MMKLYMIHTINDQGGTGTATNKKTRKYAKDMNGFTPTKDQDPVDAGHLISDSSGGTGRSTHNIVPQSAHMNRGAWLNEVETLAYQTAYTYGKTEFTVMPVYESATATRPYKLDYQIVSEGIVLKGDLLNPILTKKEIEALKAIDKRVKQWEDQGDFNENAVHIVFEVNPTKKPKMGLPEIMNSERNPKMAIDFLTEPDETLVYKSYTDNFYDSVLN